MFKVNRCFESLHELASKNVTAQTETAALSLCKVVKDRCRDVSLIESKTQVRVQKEGGNVQDVSPECHINDPVFSTHPLTLPLVS